MSKIQFDPKLDLRLLIAFCGFFVAAGVLYSEFRHLQTAFSDLQDTVSGTVEQRFAVDRRQSLLEQSVQFAGNERGVLRRDISGIQKAVEDTNKKVDRLLELMLESRRAQR